MNDEHVKASKRHLLQLSAPERIRAIQQDVWIDCPQSIQVLNMIKNIVQAPSQSLAPCMLVCGEGGSGKSSIIRQLKLISKGWDEQIIFMALNENPGSLSFRDHLLEAMGIPRSARSRLKPNVPEELAEFVKLRKVRAIVIDEFHDALISNRSEQLKTLSILKGLSGEPYSLSVIGFGTSLARNALLHDTQLSRRYHIHEIQKWTKSETFREFLAALEENIPLLKPSMLYGANKVKFILSNSGGVTDNIVKMIKYGAILAVSRGEEEVSIKSMQEAILNPWAYKC